MSNVEDIMSDYQDQAGDHSRDTLIEPDEAASGPEDSPPVGGKGASAASERDKYLVSGLYFFQSFPIGFDPSDYDFSC